VFPALADARELAQAAVGFALFKQVAKVRQVDAELRQDSGIRQGAPGY